MQIDPPLKCPHCDADMEIISVSKPTIYVAVCPKRALVEHPEYIYAPSVEIK